MNMLLLALFLLTVGASAGALPRVKTVQFQPAPNGLALVRVVLDNRTALDPGVKVTTSGSLNSTGNPAELDMGLAVFEAGTVHTGGDIRLNVVVSSEIGARPPFAVGFHLDSFEAITQLFWVQNTYLPVSYDLEAFPAGWNSTSARWSLECGGTQVVKGAPWAFRKSPITNVTGCTARVSYSADGVVVGPAVPVSVFFSAMPTSVVSRAPKTSFTFAMFLVTYLSSMHDRHD